MDYLHKPNRLLITGRSGTGKTEFFIRYVKATRQQYRRIHVFDCECEFSQRGGFPRLSNVDELQKFKSGVQCFDYCEMYPGDLQTALEFYADYTFECAKVCPGKTLFCVDEMQKLISTDTISHEMACLIETGRRYRVDTVFVTQQINLLHNRVRNQVTEVCTFRQNDPRAIQWLTEFGFTEERIRELNTGDYICRRDDGVERVGNIFRGFPKPSPSTGSQAQAKSVDKDEGNPDSSVSESSEDDGEETGPDE
jgi:hypothetical protein